MKPMLVGAALSLLLAVPLTGPLAAPPAQAGGLAAHHACLEEERQAIERGQGFGMALVADRNGFPGPRHILDMKDELELSADQVRDVQQLFDKMHSRAVELGNELLAKEAELDRLFAQSVSGEASVRHLLTESALLRAELRWVHIFAHLEARDLLTPEQRHAYHAARYGSAGHVH